MSPLLRLWFYLFFVRLSYAGLVNITIEADDPRIVYSDGWQAGSCGIETCAFHESLSFRFTGVALYYIIGRRPSSSGDRSLNVTLDRNITQVVVPAGSLNQDCNNFSFSSENLAYSLEHGVKLTLAGNQQTDPSLTDCISFNGFIYTTFDNNTSHTSGPPAATSTSAQGARGGSNLSLILGLSIGAVVLVSIIAGLIVHTVRRKQPPTTVPMLDRSLNWALGRKNHKRRDSTQIQKAGPAKDFIPPHAHDRNWQELQ